MIKGKTLQGWFGFKSLLILIPCAAFIYGLYTFSIGWYNPILDKHEFRQTQTALSVYWMLKEGGIVAYQTPVCGAPWTIPFEFPLYQWIVAAMYLITKMPLDQCGKLVSIVFFYMTLLPVYSLFKNLKFDKELFYVFSALLFACPVYLFWSRTFMIESLALFLSLSYVALIQQYVSTRRTILVFVVMLVGSVASLVKLTTFVPACVFAGGLLARDYCANVDRRISKDVVDGLVASLLFILTPILLCVVWTNYADMIKTNSGELSAMLVSNKLEAWVFGTCAQRVSYALWVQTILKSISLNMGYYSIVLYGVALCICSRSREIGYALWSLFCFVSSFLVFTNLYIVHDYYQYENAIYLILFASFVVYKLASTHRFRFTALALLLATMCLQYYSYNYVAFDPQYKPPYRSVLDEDTTRHRDFIVGTFIDNNVSSEAAIVVYGNDWCPTIAYYSKRKSVTDHLRGDYRERLKNVKGLLGGKAIGAVVVCSPNRLENDEIARKALNRMTTGSLVTNIYNAKVYYFPSRSATRDKVLELNRTHTIEIGR